MQTVPNPVQVKKNKKKARTDVKPVQHVSTNDWKEPDEGKTGPTAVQNLQFSYSLPLYGYRTVFYYYFGQPGAWETKVSHREKKQQRRKDKGPEDSGSPGGTAAPKPHVVTALAKKNRGNSGNLCRNND